MPSGAFCKPGIGGVTTAMLLETSGAARHRGGAVPAAGGFCRCGVAAGRLPSCSSRLAARRSTAAAILRTAPPGARGHQVGIQLPCVMKQAVMFARSFGRFRTSHLDSSVDDWTISRCFMAACALLPVLSALLHVDSKLK
jgi:hypothetical protein